MYLSKGGRLADVYTLGALKRPSGETVEPALSGTKISEYDIPSATSEQLLHHNQPLIRSYNCMKNRDPRIGGWSLARETHFALLDSGQLTPIIMPCIQKLTELSFRVSASACLAMLLSRNLMPILMRLDCGNGASVRTMSFPPWQSGTLESACPLYHYSFTQTEICVLQNA
jgi:hypothetical protein